MTPLEFSFEGPSDIFTRTRARKFIKELLHENGETITRAERGTIRRVYRYRVLSVINGIITITCSEHDWRLLMRYAAKVDRNQGEIVEALRKLGFAVDVVHREKKLYDLVVTGLHRGANIVCSLRVEVKMPGKKLSPDEQDYWDKQVFRDKDGNPECLIIAESADDVLRWFGHID